MGQIRNPMLYPSELRAHLSLELRPHPSLSARFHDSNSHAAGP